MNDVIKTIRFISEAHAGQTYNGMPYYFHPIAVANALSNPTEIQYIAALLHDVVEDTEYSITTIEHMFGYVVAGIVYQLTKKDHLSYKENIQRIIDSNSIGAMKIKYADNFINITSDMSGMTDARRLRLTERYEMSMKMLTKAIGGVE